MAHFIESLESRTLLSGAAQVAILQADGKALVADVKALGKTITAAYKTIEADVKAAGDAKTDKALVKAFQVGGKAGFNVLSKSVKHTISLLTSNVKKGEALEKALIKKPGNATLEAKFTAIETTLQTNASNSLAAITADLSALDSTNSTNVTALVSADPNDTQLSNDVTNTIAPNAQAAEAAVSTIANTALVTDIAALLS